MVRTIGARDNNVYLSEVGISPSGRNKSVLCEYVGKSMFKIYLKQARPTSIAVCGVRSELVGGTELLGGKGVNRGEKMGVRWVRDGCGEEHSNR